MNDSAVIADANLAFKALVPNRGDLRERLGASSQVELYSMKIFSLVVISMWGGLSTLAQTGSIQLNNNFVPPGGSSKAYVFGLTALNGRVEVLDSTGALIKRGPISPLPGLFFFGITEIPGTNPGGPGSITIRAWDTTTGSTFESALVKDSALVTLKIVGGGTIGVPTLGYSGNFTGLFVPEPSTYALASIGVAALYFVARRK